MSSSILQTMKNRTAYAANMSVRQALVTANIAGRNMDGVNTGEKKLLSPIPLKRTIWMISTHITPGSGNTKYGIAYI